MLNKNISISDSEWQIMKVIWEVPNINLKEISERVDKCGWSYSTIRTLVKRLVDKGVIAADKSISNNFKYYSIVSEEECKKKEVKSFLEKVFNGSAGMLISALTKDSELSEKEKEKLRDIIDKIDK